MQLFNLLINFPKRAPTRVPFCDRIKGIQLLLLLSHKQAVREEVTDIKKILLSQRFNKKKSLRPLYIFLPLWYNLIDWIALIFIDGR